MQRQSISKKTSQYKIILLLKKVGEQYIDQYCYPILSRWKKKSKRLERFEIETFEKNCFIFFLIRNFLSKKQ